MQAEGLVCGELTGEGVEWFRGSVARPVAETT